MYWDVDRSLRTMWNYKILLSYTVLLSGKTELMQTQYSQDYFGTNNNPMSKCYQRVY